MKMKLFADSYELVVDSNKVHIRNVCCPAHQYLTLNSSCDFDTFVRILYECFWNAQRSYT